MGLLLHKIIYIYLYIYIYIYICIYINIDRKKRIKCDSYIDRQIIHTYIQIN